MINHDTEIARPFVGLLVCPDNWQIGDVLAAGDNYSDDSFPGCQYRMYAGQNYYHLATNIHVTGRKAHYSRAHGMWKTRVKIEFVGDGEPSTFNGGWIYHKHPETLEYLTEGEEYLNHLMQG